MIAKKEVFLSPDSFGTTLLIAAIDSFGIECLSWEPETLEMEIKTTFDIDIPEANLDRLQAAMSILTSNLFYVSLEAFNVTCNSLNFSKVDGKTFIPADIEDIMWGITEATLLLGVDANKNEFSRDIRLYVGKVLESEGILDPPSILRFADMRQFDTSTLQEVADMPDLSSLFSASLADTKLELDSWALQRVNDLFSQIGEMILDNGSKEDFGKMVERFRGL